MKSKSTTKNKSKKTKAGKTSARTTTKVPRSLRWPSPLKEKFESYLTKNDLKGSVVIRDAVAEYIAKDRTITLKSVGADEFLESYDDVTKEHKDAIEKLK